MYYAHFGLTEAPFKITPNTDFFFAGGSRGEVLEALVFSIAQGEGIVKVTGEVGSGKTMLCRMLEDRLPDNVETVYLANPSVSPEEILHAIAAELQLDISLTASRLEVMQRLQQHLLERHEAGQRVVVFVEEAQSMRVEALEEMRFLSNLETRHDKLLQLVLFGQPELDQNLARQHIRQLRERITQSFALRPLNAKEIHAYIDYRLRAAGYHGPELFNARAARMIARASKGLTRRVNIIADKSLLAAYGDGTHTVTPRHIRAAIRDSAFGARLWRFWPAW